MANSSISSWYSYAISLLSSAMKWLQASDPNVKSTADWNNVTVGTPPPSRLLLLPPEIRNLILEELIPRDRCARGDVRVDVDLITSKVCRSRGSLLVSYLRTCRKFYEEGSHFYYSTSVFHFDDFLDISYFMNRRSFAQLCSIQHLQFTVPDMIFSFNSWDEIDLGLHLMALEVKEILHTTRRLQNLQSLDLLVSIPNCPEYTREKGYLTQMIHRFFDHVNQSAIVTVNADLCDYVKAPSIESLDHYVIKEKDWRPHWSVKFKTFGWAFLSLKSQNSSIASRTNKAAREVHMNYVLRAVTWYDGST